MIPRLSLALILILFLLSIANAQSKYVVSYGGFSGYQVPIWVTKELGLLEKYKINGDLVMMPGSTRQMQALLGGSIQFSQIDATAPVTAYLRGPISSSLPAPLINFLSASSRGRKSASPPTWSGKKLAS